MMMVVVFLGKLGCMRANNKKLSLPVANHWDDELIN
jgi:hypothetical protein